ncbi:MAG: hypothetical protein K6D94_02500 [Clostridiales bacterium]|nr:hypothetical protein [Clostridiales bacterium]
MPIHFDMSRMKKVMDAHEAWWEQTSGDDLLSIVVPDAYEDSRTPKVPTLSQANCADFSYAPDDIIEAYDIAMSRNEYLGSAFPYIDFAAYGPGVLAAFCGGNLDNSSGGVWFFPPEWFTAETPLSELHIKYDPENVYVKRIKDIYRAGIKRWNGLVIMGMPDLGGVMDVVASMVTTERLLYSLIDEPEEIERLVSETETAWYAAYNDLSAVLAPQGGHTDWNGLLSASPSYVTQCDFCYMLGNDMFRRFVLPTLKRDTEKLAHVIYHLDGVGELPHLDDVLSIERLKAVQWVYGAGKPSGMYWIDVYRRIAAAGKNIMVVGGPGDYYEIAREIKVPLYSRQWLPRSYEKEAEKMLSLMSE